MVTHEDLITVLFSAFAGFTAFGAAIGGFLAAGGGVQDAIFKWTQHGLDEVAAKRKAGKLASERQVRRAMWLASHRVLALWLMAAFISLVVLASGLGLFTSFWWLYTGAAWSYRGAIYLFEAETVALTVVTLSAVAIAATGSMSGRSDSNEKQI
jgi:hypothetical protein